jgi:CRISPR system Cascade subunit CasE
MRTLWRLDHNADQQVALYIASPGKPDLTHLVEQAGWPTTDTWQTRPYDDFLDSLTNNQRWAFRITANPVRDGRMNKEAPDTQRFGNVTVQQQADWLLNRSERCGFTIVDGHDGHRNLLVHRRMTHSFTRKHGEKPVTIQTATYDGVLQIDDVQALRHTLTSGLGHAKAYGCGLLTLAPAS